MQKLFITFLCILTLSSCTWVRKMDVEQGNIITPDLTQRLRIGMTKSQVEEIMGTPTLLNTFNDNRVNYVYTFQPGGGCRHEKQLILTFSKGEMLRDIQERDFVN